MHKDVYATQVQHLGSLSICVITYCKSFGVPCLCPCPYRCNGDASRLGIMLGNVESRLTQLEEENEQLLSALDEEKR